MAFLSSLDIPASGLTAQKKRLDIITENIVHRETTRTENGGPYRRKLAVFREILGKPGSFSSFLERARFRRFGGNEYGGVMVSEVIEDNAPFIPVYDPGHPDADDNGYVMMPNVDNTVEMIDAMSATRSYSANIAALEAVKAMAAKALEIGR